MKFDAISPVNSVNGKTGTARKLADNSAVKASSQDDPSSQFTNYTVKAPTQGDQPSQLNNPFVKDQNPNDPQSQTNDGGVKTPTQDDQQAQLALQQKEKVEKALKIINMAYKEVNIESNYFIDERTNTEVVKIVNSITGELIKQYPPQDILNMIHKMYDMYGILMDEKA
jgi:flagellar protein FlaG